MARRLSPEGLALNLSVSDDGHTGGLGVCGDLHHWEAPDDLLMGLVCAIIAGLDRISEAPTGPVALAGPFGTKCGRGVLVRLVPQRGGFMFLEVAPLHNPKTESNWGLPSIMVPIFRQTAEADIRKAAEYAANIISDGWTLASILPKPT